jgi:steroid delta-isomerase-like uncharacterized protein
MAVLSIMSLQGDPDDLLARMQTTIDPVAARKAPQYGGISSTVVRTDDGITIYNLWSTEKGRHEMADDPEIRAALKEAGLPEPHFTGYEVLSRRSAGDLGKELATRIVEEVWTQGKLDALDELLTPDCLNYDPVNGESRGPQAVRELVEKYRSAFPDMTMRVDRMVADGDWTATHWTAVGTHTGELMGIAPTGREVTVTGINFDRVADGRIAESRAVFDALGMLQQVGAVPGGAAAHA